MNLKLSELDLSEIPLWSKPARTAFVALICIVVAFLVYLFDIRPQAAIQKQLEATAIDQRERAKALYNEGQRLPEFLAYIQKQKDLLKEELRQLPRATEMPSLLEDISRTGLASGLELRAITPNPEADKDFYVELPIDIVARGGYHAIGRFISDAANLSRVVTFHDFKLAMDKDEQLTVKIVAKTYHYDDQKLDAPPKSEKVEKPGGVN